MLYDIFNVEEKRFFKPHLVPVITIQQFNELECVEIYYVIWAQVKKTIQKTFGIRTFEYDTSMRKDGNGNDLSIIHIQTLVDLIQQHI